MRLDDTVTLTSSGTSMDVPAHVYYTSTGVDVGSGNVYATEQLRAIVPRLPELPMTPTTSSVTWRGDQYSLAGPPMVRMRRGRVHHYTIPLQRTTT